MFECKYKANNGWCRWHKRWCDMVNSKQCPYKKPYKNQITNKGKHYKYYLVEYSMGNGEFTFDELCAQYTIVKALSIETAQNQVSKRYTSYGNSDYSSVLVHFGNTLEFSTYEEANNYLERNINDEG